MVDETKGTPGTNPDGTPKDESKGTPKNKGKNYTDAEIEKIKSDAASMGHGREKKVADQEKAVLTQELESTKSRLDALEREATEARYADAKAGGPEALTAYQKEQGAGKLQRELDDLKRELNRREEQLKVDREAVDKDKHTISVASLAAKHGLETDELESLGINDTEALERVAIKLAAGRPKTEPGEGGEEGDTPSGEVPELVPDSSEGTGSVEGTLTAESVGKGSIASVAKALEKTSD